MSTLYFTVSISYLSLLHAIPDTQPTPHFHLQKRDSYFEEDESCLFRSSSNFFLEVHMMTPGPLRYSCPALVTSLGPEKLLISPPQL